MKKLGNIFPRLGDRRYVMSLQTGVVEATIINALKLQRDGEIRYSTLISGVEFTDIDEALKGSVEQMTKLLATTNFVDTLHATEERIAHLMEHLEDARSGLLQETIFRRESRFDPRPRRGEPVPVDMSKIPSDYFVPGEKVWAVITPLTHNFTSGAGRFGTYYLQQILIKGTRIGESGGIDYSFDGSWYITRHRKDTVERLHRTKRSAKDALISIFAQETPGEITDPRQILSVTYRQERKAEKKAWAALAQSAMTQESVVMMKLHG